MKPGYNFKARQGDKATFIINGVQSPLITLTCSVQIITKLERQEREPWPVGRSDHAACCLGFGSQHPHLLVTGGRDNKDKTLRDAWLFDVTNRRWKEVSGVGY